MVRPSGCASSSMISRARTSTDSILERRATSSAKSTSEKDAVHNDVPIIHRYTMYSSNQSRSWKKIWSYKTAMSESTSSTRIQLRVSVYRALNRLINSGGRSMLARSRKALRSIHCQNNVNNFAILASLWSYYSNCFPWVRMIISQTS